MKASDIHFDPMETGLKIRIRIDGALQDYSIVPLYVEKNIITRIKIISGMNITESRIPQDGAIKNSLDNVIDSITLEDMINKDNKNISIVKEI